jgi:hypothetical protein
VAAFSQFQLMKSSVRLIGRQAKACLLDHAQALSDQVDSPGRWKSLQIQVLAPIPIKSNRADLIGLCSGVACDRRKALCGAAESVPV